MAIGKRSFGRVQLRGRSLVPNPPARIKAFKRSLFSEEDLDSVTLEQKLCQITEYSVRSLKRQISEVGTPVVCEVNELSAVGYVSFDELRPSGWPDIERLFGLNGACGGCWCMCWRAESYKAWQRVRGAGARKAFRECVLKGKAHGILAFAKSEPVGWCSIGPRNDFPLLQKSKTYKQDDLDDVWSVTCFFIHRNWRRRGLSRGLLKAAVEAMRKRGVGVVEAYPVTTTKDGRRIGSSMAWTGPLAIYEELGFKVVQTTNPRRPLVRLQLR